MKRCIFAIAAVAAALSFGCAAPRPGGSRAPSSGISGVVAPALGAVAGAAIGKNNGGDGGALIGAAAGALVGHVAGQTASNWYNAQLDESAETARREERVAVMKDYWESHAVSGGNAPQSSGPAAAPTERPVQYPAGVYDGVLYAPRVQTGPRE